MATVTFIFANQTGPIPLSELDQDFVDCCVAANNLSELTVPVTARNNLGLGSMAVQGAANVAITGGTLNNVAISSSTVNGGIPALINSAQTFTSAQSGVITPFSGSVTAPFIPDLSRSNNWAATLTSGITLNYPINITPGTSGIMTFTQSSSGNCQIVLQSGYLSVSTVVTLSVTPNARTSVSYFTLSSSQVLISALTLRS